MELNFVREDIPKITRAGGSGREAEPWENHLATLKDTPGVAFRVWDYEKRSSAVSRMSSVRDRLNKAVPSENWTLAVRAIPNADPARFGVYVSYNGTFTDEEMAENAKKHAERSARVKASRNKPADNQPVESADPTGESPVGDTGEVEGQTPKERVAAAAAKQTRKAS